MTCSHLSSFGERALNGFDKTNKCVQFIFHREHTTASVPAPVTTATWQWQKGVICMIFVHCWFFGNSHNGRRHMMIQLTFFLFCHSTDLILKPIFRFGLFTVSGLAPHFFFLHSTLPLHFSRAHTFICCYLIFWWHFRSNDRNKREIYKAGLFEMNYSSRLVMHVCIVRFVCWRCVHFRIKVLFMKNV